MPDQITNPDVSRERSDVSMKVIAWMLGAVAVLIGVTLLGLWLMFDYLDGRERRAKSDTPPLVAAESRLHAELSPDEQLRRRVDGRPLLEGLPPEDPVHRVGPWRERTPEAQAEAERERLDGYGWVNRDKGMVHVPLERAQGLAIEDRSKYLPARKEKRP